MRSVFKLSGLVLAALTATACVAGPGAANPGQSGTPSTPATPAPTATPKPSPSGPPAIDHPTGKDSLVLRITLDGGFVPVGWSLTNLPVISIYGDGRVITQGAQIMIYPGPALPSLWVKHITEAGLQKILAAAAEAGLLGADKQYDDGGMVADAATTTFILNAGGRVHTISAYALFEAENPGPNLSKEDEAARKLLRTFLSQITDLGTLVGASELSAEEAYTPAAIRLFVTPVDPAQPAPTDVPEQEPIAWPLKTPLADFGTVTVRGGALGDMRCGIVEAADLDTLLPLLEKANALTQFTDKGKSYTFLVRPLLPDETGCPTFE